MTLTPVVFQEFTDAYAAVLREAAGWAILATAAPPHRRDRNAAIPQPCGP